MGGMEHVCAPLGVVRTILKQTTHLQGGSVGASPAYERGCSSLKLLRSASAALTVARSKSS